MKRCPLLLLWCGWSLCLWASGPSVRFPSVEQLLHSLDTAMEEHARYVDRCEQRIRSLKQRQQARAVSSRSYFCGLDSIYAEYKAYNCDSALLYLRRGLQWATEYGTADDALSVRLKQVYHMASAGMYREASDILEEVPRGAVPSGCLPSYYYSCHKLYDEMIYYTQDEDFRRRYTAQAVCYADSLQRVLDASSPLGREREERALRLAGRLTDALAMNDLRLEHLSPETPAYALVTYQRALIYRSMGEREEEKRFLALSALTDIRLAIADHASLWDLAHRLYEEGDVERAYRYIRFSWQETTRYNARSRYLQTSGILSLIDQAYQAVQARQAFRLKWYLVLISVLVVLLGGTLFYICRQMRRLAAARNSLECANEQLQLSNRIKEEYIGRFLNLCSTYIDRLSTCRRSAVRNGGRQEAWSADQLKEAELKELYANFDEAFLKIFPDFIEQFNALLLPEERIVPKAGELLNTELRIFALIRLGIYDSAAIAKFLNYSVNTIYNYRAKVKGKARCPREDFEAYVKKIR